MNHKKHTSGLFRFLPPVLLSVWYLLCVCGIDIHSDVEHGQVFVVPGIIGCDCDLIHPGQHCFDTADDGDCLDGEECCSDFFSAVLAQGEDQDSGDNLPSAPVSELVATLHPQSVPAGTAACISGLRGNAPPPPLIRFPFSKLSVLRI